MRSEYWWGCGNCGRTYITNDDLKTCKCKCGSIMKIGKVVVIPRIKNEPVKARTIHSRALAVDPSQVEEAERMYPDEHYVINEKEHIAMLEIHNAKERDKFAKRHGMVLLD